MLRVLDIPIAGGEPVFAQGEELAVPPPEGHVRWIDLATPSETRLAFLRNAFGFHPLAIEDCLHFDQRPKLEEYDDHLFIVIHGFRPVKGEPIQAEAQEIHAFLGAGYLVTVHNDSVTALEDTWKRVLADPGLGRRGADFLYYLLADAIVDANFPILDHLSEVLEDTEDAILARPDPEDLARLFVLKRTFVNMRRVLSPERDLLGLLAKRGHGVIGERTALYFRDIYDHLVRIYENIDNGRDLLGNALDAYLSLVSNRTNEIMKRLTILSAIFLPLAFVVGFFGQNFASIPFGSRVLLVVSIASCVMIPTGMLYWFLKSKWL